MSQLLTFPEPKLVNIESPFRGEGDNYELTARNIYYARLCAADCLYRRQETPYVSHLLLTQAGITDDTNPLERQRGVEYGRWWIPVCALTAVYGDFGISEGMDFGIELSKHFGIPVEYRQLEGVIELEAEIERLSKIEQVIIQGVKF